MQLILPQNLFFLQALKGTGQGTVKAGAEFQNKLK